MCVCVRVCVCVRACVCVCVRVCMRVHELCVFKSPLTFTTGVPITSAETTEPQVGNLRLGKETDAMI